VAEGEDISALINAAGGNGGASEGTAAPPSCGDKSKSDNELATKNDGAATRPEIAAAPDVPAGARFLKTLKAMLEEPGASLL